MCKKIMCLATIFCFFFTSLTPIPKASAQSVLGLPAPGTMVNLSPAYQPVIIRGLTVHKNNPFLFDFIVDVGQDKMSGQPLKKEGEKLIKYFLASLAIPDKDVWVNLSPYEKNKMIPEALGQTDMGRDLLEQDYILKQVTASLIYPERDLGEKFWDTVYAKAQQKYGAAEIPVNTFNKVWIMADKAEVFERNQTAFVVNAHLKVMLEEDYLALNKHNGIQSVHQTTHSMASQITREIVLPELEKEINTGKNFANLRQIYNSVILAAWYKKNLQQALLSQIYADKTKVKGINLNDPTVKQQIYEQYLEAYKKGVFHYIKDDINTASGQNMPRKYFSGGVSRLGIEPAITTNVGKLKTALLSVISLVILSTFFSCKKETGASPSTTTTVSITFVSPVDTVAAYPNGQVLYSVATNWTAGMWNGGYLGTSLSGIPPSLVTSYGLLNGVNNATYSATYTVATVSTDTVHLYSTSNAINSNGFIFLTSWDLGSGIDSFTVQGVTYDYLPPLSASGGMGLVHLVQSEQSQQKYWLTFLEGGMSGSIFVLVPKKDNAMTSTKAVFAVQETLAEAVQKALNALEDGMTFRPKGNSDTLVTVNITPQMKDAVNRLLLIVHPKVQLKDNTITTKQIDALQKWLNNTIGSPGKVMVAPGAQSFSFYSGLPPAATKKRIVTAIKDPLILESIDAAMIDRGKAAIIIYAIFLSVMIPLLIVKAFDRPRPFVSSPKLVATFPAGVLYSFYDDNGKELLYGVSPKAGVLPSLLTEGIVNGNTAHANYKTAPSNKDTVILTGTHESTGFIFLGRDDLGLDNGSFIYNEVGYQYSGQLNFYGNTLIVTGKSGLFAVKTGQRYWLVWLGEDKYVMVPADKAMANQNQKVREDEVKISTRSLYGGIDLNTAGIQWKISKDGKGVEMNIDPALIAGFREHGIDSLSPVIIKITPVANIWPLLGVPTPEKL